MEGLCWPGKSCVHRVDSYALVPLFTQITSWDGVFAVRMKCACSRLGSFANALK